MISIVLGFSLFVTQIQPPRLRTVLPNRATILVEPVANAHVISIQLWASSRGVEERTETHGLRHLLEHIMALGPNRDLDYRLESVGGSLRAKTFRDATQIEVNVPADQFELGLSAISEMLVPVQVTPEQIGTESKVIDQEQGLMSDDLLISSAAWQTAYGDDALDPFGDLEVIKNATPADIEAIHKRQFAAQNLVLVISGPVGLDGATSKARGVLEPLTKLSDYHATDRPQGKGGVATAQAFGEARAAVVTNFSNPKTVSALAAALAIASRLDDCYVTYTPSLQNGLVILGRTDSNQGLGAYIDSLDEGAMGSLYAPGKSLARAWVERQLHSPTQIGYLRGLLMSQNIGARPEDMLDAIQQISFADFKEGVAALKTPAAVAVRGEQ
jgi:hypothetical protein